MANWLANHPNVYFAPIKEPHYFNTDSSYRHVEDLDAYEALFAGANVQHAVVAEASVWYLYSLKAIENILRYSPQARFLVMVRNPVDMVHSLHQQLVFSRRENVKDFQAAWHAQEARRSGTSIPPLSRDPRHLVYGDVCRLGAQVARLLSLAPRNQCHFVVLDDLKENPRREYERVMDFASLPDDFRMDFKAENQAKARKWPAVASAVETVRHYRKRLLIPNLNTRILHVLDSRNRRAAPREALPDGLRNELQRYFAEDIRELGTLLGRDLSSWTRQTRQPTGLS